MINTIDERGDDVVFAELVSGTFSGQFNDDVIENVGENTFAESGITSVNFPNVRTIETSSFYQCKALSHIDMPNVEKVSNSAFYGDTGITDVTMDNVTELGYEAFRNSGLVNASFKNLKSLGGYCLTGTKLKEIDLPEVTDMAMYCFSSTRSLKTANLPKAENARQNEFDSSSVEVVNMPKLKGISNAMFYRDSSLRELHCPEVETIARGAFYNTTSLKSLKLPKLKSIAAEAFQLSGIETIIIGTEINEVCSIQSDSFDAKAMNIYVPVDLLNAYKSSTNWSVFASSLFPYETPVECMSLSISAQEQIKGTKKQVKVRYNAVCTYSIDGEVKSGTKVFEGEAMSDVFGENPSYTESRTVTVSYTYKGITATTMITQSPNLEHDIDVSTADGSNFSWIRSEEEDEQEYICYKTDIPSSVRTGSGAIRIELKGYTSMEVKFTAKSGSWLASKPNVSKVPTAWNSPETYKYSGSQITYTGINDGDYVYINWFPSYINSSCKIQIKPE